MQEVPLDSSGASGFADTAALGRGRGRQRRPVAAALANAVFDATRDKVALRAVHSRARQSGDSGGGLGRLGATWEFFISTIGLFPFQAQLELSVS